MSDKKENKLFDRLSGISDMLDGKSQVIPIISPDAFYYDFLYPTG